MFSHGRSPDWNEAGDFLDRTITLMTPLFDSKMDLIGHSFGGIIALRFATLFPEKVRSLTLIEPILFAVAMAGAPDILADHDAEVEPFVEAIKAGDRTLKRPAFDLRHIR